MPGRPERAFLWGAGSAAHQTDGCNVNTGRCRTEHPEASHPSVGVSGGDACDSYDRWGEDLDLLDGAGFTDYGFSIEWGRIDPHAGRFAKASLAHYRLMVEGSLGRGRRPKVTLHHFTNPAWFDARSGWQSSGASSDAYTHSCDADFLRGYTEFREDIFVDAGAQDDWIGVQAHTRTRFTRVEPVPKVLPPPHGAELTLTGWDYYPQAVADAVRRVHALVGIPITVTETGSATSDDDRRIEHIEAAPPGAVAGDGRGRGRARLFPLEPAG